MNAVIKVGGKQVLASEGETIYVEKINGNVGDTVKFNEVLMLGDKIGNPYVENAVVEGTIEKQGKQKKILVFKYKQKDRANRRTHGHRQPYTMVKITKIAG
jgi:large subunit ribosomal protein L21